MQYYMSCWSLAWHHSASQPIEVSLPPTISVAPQATICNAQMDIWTPWLSVKEADGSQPMPWSDAIYGQRLSLRRCPCWSPVDTDWEPGDATSSGFTVPVSHLCPHSSRVDISPEDKKFDRRGVFSSKGKIKNFKDTRVVVQARMNPKSQVSTSSIGATRL